MELTKYEKARIVGARALQLALGAPPLVKADKRASFIDVALAELEKNVIPISILK